MNSIKLHCQEGGSDKVYEVAINPKGEKYTVDFAFGRRGASLNTGTKTNEPVDLSDAHKIFNKLVKEKTKKGYMPVEEGHTAAAPPSSTGNGNDTGLRPQLLAVVEGENELEALLANDDYVMQEKKDGVRNIIEKKGTMLRLANKRGISVDVPAELGALLVVSRDFTLDCERIDNKLHAFDILELDGQDIRGLPQHERLYRLQGLFASELAIEGSALVTVIEPVYTCRGSKKEKLAYLEYLKNKKAEGVVFKRKDSLYTPGRTPQGGDQIKFKFYATASFLVTKVNDKRSVQLALIDTLGRKVPSGNVTIPSNRNIPKPGDICEVKYLYAFRSSGSVFQPVWLGLREDLIPEDCSTLQIKYKSEPEESDEL